MKNQVFFPQSLLDLLVDADEIELDGQELVLRDAGYRYKIVEAVRIVGEVPEGSDPRGLTGKVKSRRHLTELGAELLGDSMLIEETAYDVQPGFVGLPIGPFDAPEQPSELTEVQLLSSLRAKVPI